MHTTWSEVIRQRRSQGQKYLKAREGGEVFNRGEKMMLKGNWWMIEYKGFRMERKAGTRQGRKGKLKTEVEKTEREMKMVIFRVRRDKER